MKSTRMHLLMCFGTGCVSSGAQKVADALKVELAARGLTDTVAVGDLDAAKASGEVSVVSTGCNGFCACGPLMVVYPGGIFYQKLTPEDMPELVEEHVLKGRPVERLMFRHPVTQAVIPHYADIPFFARQNLRVLHNKGRISATSIEEYIGRGGYIAAAKALLEMTPQGIIDEMKKSGLRGRGGAGFTTGMKWDFAAKPKSDQKYFLCNADEGDPGAFMDRSVLESDPHAVLEGMLIGARAIGASQGYIYCRAEYPLAIERLNLAIAQCRERGLLGKDILGTGFDFDIEIARGSGAFVCGEETALMRSIEGKRGEPRPRPPFPAIAGLWEKPTVLNNVETLANVPLIISHGADWFRSVGTEKSPGTKIFALTGKVNNVGLVEVNMGVPLGEIIYDIGGGIPNGKKFKAAQIGGPSGGCIPKEHLNTPVDYESITALGAIMGSGGLIVMDEDSCMVDMARFFLEFTQDESCGKCTPCRVGTRRMLEILDRICTGKGVDGDIERLQALGETIKDSALCGLGQTAPNPVLSFIRFFREEFVEHIRDHKCRAGVCADLVRAPCQNACPAGVDIPGFVSLTGEKRYNEALRLHRERNPFVAVCARVCFHPCEGKCRRATLDEPLSVRAVKRFLADQEVGFQTPAPIGNGENAKRKVAVVGAGPSGLSCAYFLARLGYTPTVYEAADKAGGMLLQAIPAYRLPRDILANEIRGIAEMGVSIKYKKKLGRDFTLQSLKELGFEAVFLGVGAPQGMGLGMKGEDMEGVVDALGFLKEYNLTGKAKVGKNVVVIGGGNAAVDAARTALRLGAQSATVVYRRTQAEMPAYAEEVEEAEREGVKFEFLAAPLELVGKAGAVASAKFRTMELGDFDRTGRRKPVAKGENDFTLPADMVIAAIGQTLKPEELFDGISVKLNERHYLAADPVTGQTSVEWVFAGGDATNGPSSVVQAIAEGEKAAAGIDRFLTGANHAVWRENRVVNTFFDPEADPVMANRPGMKLIPVAKRKGTFAEVEIAWPRAVALGESKRCLRCDYREAAAPAAAA
ncbi:MAG: NADH-quinone oxidoreductase subunit NuoF, partial [Spirochaetia bacterium]